MEKVYGIRDPGDDGPDLVKRDINHVIDLAEYVENPKGVAESLAYMVAKALQRRGLTGGSIDAPGEVLTDASPVVFADVVRGVFNIVILNRDWDMPVNAPRAPAPVEDNLDPTGQLINISDLPLPDPRLAFKLEHYNSLVHIDETLLRSILLGEPVDPEQMKCINYATGLPVETKWSCPNAKNSNEGTSADGNTPGALVQR